MAKSTIFIKDNHKGGVDLSFQPTIGEALKRLEKGHPSSAYHVMLEAAKAIAELQGRPATETPEEPKPHKLADLTADGVRSVMMEAIGKFAQALNGTFRALIEGHGANPDRYRIEAMLGGQFRLVRIYDGATLLRWSAPRVRGEDDSSIVFEWSIFPVSEEAING